MSGPYNNGNRNWTGNGNYAGQPHQRQLVSYRDDFERPHVGGGQDYRSAGYEQHRGNTQGVWNQGERCLRSLAPNGELTRFVTSASGGGHQDYHRQPAPYYQQPYYYQPYPPGPGYGYGHDSRSHAATHPAQVASRPAGAMASSPAYAPRPLLPQKPAQPQRASVPHASAAPPPPPPAAAAWSFPFPYLASSYGKGGRKSGRAAACLKYGVTHDEVLNLEQSWKASNPAGFARLEAGAGAPPASGNGKKDKAGQKHRQAKVAKVAEVVSTPTQIDPAKGRAFRELPRDVFVEVRCLEIRARLG